MKSYFASYIKLCLLILIFCYFMLLPNKNIIKWGIKQGYAIAPCLNVMVHKNKDRLQYFCSKISEGTIVIFRVD